MRINKIILENIGPYVKENVFDLSVENTLVIRDGSASMTMEQNGIQPLTVATAIAIYASEHNTKEWQNKFITFSNRPKFINLSNCNTLLDKLEKCYAEDDCSNTDIYKTMELILGVAVNNGNKQNQLPQTILLISDMQFDSSQFHMDKTLFEEISYRFKQFGYKLPKLVFWNLSGRTSNTIPLQQNDYGLILISGFSTHLFEMVMSNEFDPYKALIKILSSKRYQPVQDALRAVD